MVMLEMTVWLAVAVWAWVDARHEVDELMDSHLAQAAAILVVQPLDMETGAGPDAPRLNTPGVAASRGSHAARARRRAKANGPQG